MPALPIAGDVDLATSAHRFFHAVATFFNSLATIGWGYLLAALLLSLAMQIARGHAWANALRAAYPAERVRELRVVASFLVGAGLNGILPARGGDALKIVLAKRAVGNSTYPAIIASFASLAPFDFVLGVIVLIYALTQGLLPRPPELPNLPAFEISYWASHPQALMLTVTVLVIGTVVLFAFLAQRAESLWQRLTQGLAIFRPPRRYLREVAAWQALGWCLRFASFWLFLEAFGIGGSVQHVLLVMSVQSVSSALPFTPGGAGAQQALLVATLSGASRAAVLAYSVGQQLAVTAWSLLIAVLALLLVFRVTDWRAFVREGRAAQAGVEAGGS